MDQDLVADQSRVAALSAEIPTLYCPSPIRTDEHLASHIDNLLLDWIGPIGIYRGEHRMLRESSFGRLVMLCYPDAHDADRLLLAAQCLGALFAVDDYYGDDIHREAVPTLVAPRLSLALAALEPAYLVEPYSTALGTALNADPVLVGLNAYLQRVQALATPSQVARVRHEIIAVFVTMTSEAAFRILGSTQAIYEYLAQRQVNSFMPCLSLIDVVGGYELPANIYASQKVRRASVLAASATSIVNDLYSCSKESVAEIGNFNLPQLLTAERGCSHKEAVALSAEMHDALMREYEHTERELLQNATVELTRYLGGLRAWMAGNLEWHRTSGRYRVEQA